MRTHAALACSGRSAVLLRRVQAHFGGSAPRSADPTAPYLPSSADSAARQIWRMSVLTKLRPQACHARGVTSHMRGNACEQWEHARDMLGHVVHLDSLRRRSVVHASTHLQAAPQLEDFVARENVDGGEVVGGGEEEGVEDANTIRARRGRPGALASLNPFRVCQSTLTKTA